MVRWNYPKSGLLPQEKKSIHKMKFSRKMSNITAKSYTRRYNNNNVFIKTK